MHLFDFNDALAGRRCVGARRSTDGLESEASFKNQPPDLSRRMPTKHEHVKYESKVSAKSAFVKKSSQSLDIKELLAMKTAAPERVPSVVARLMGLEMLPSKSAANLQPKPTYMGHSLTRSLSDKQFQKQARDFECVPTQLLDQQNTFIREPINLSRHSLKEKAQYESSRKQSHWKKNKVIDSEAWKHSEQVRQLEQMKQQLALKQVLVQEKLTEARRLLASDQSATSNWDGGYKQISLMETDSEPKDLLRSMSLSHTYADRKDKMVSKQLDEQFPVRYKVAHKKTKSPFSPASTEDTTGPIFRNQIKDTFARPVESRRHRNFRMFDDREAGEEPLSQDWETQTQSGLSRGNTSMLESGYKGMDWDFIRKRDCGNAGGKTHKPTRIVVLKPSPTIRSNEKLLVSSGSYFHAYNCEPMIDGGMSRDRRFKVHKEEMHEDPREIAREIARQVREKVVQELARKNRSDSATVRNVESAEKTAFPDRNRFCASEIDLERFKGPIKGMACLNKPDEANKVSMSKKGIRILSHEKFGVELPEVDLTDEKKVVSHQEHHFYDGNSINGCASESQYLDSSKIEVIDSSISDPLANSGRVEKLDESSIKAIKWANKTRLQCAEVGTISFPPSLTSWPSIGQSLQGMDCENLEKEPESGLSSGNATIQDKGLIFEQLKESCNKMQTNLRQTDIHREEDTDSESSYFLPKFQGHEKIFEELSDSSHHNLSTDECFKFLSQSEMCNLTHADSSSVEVSALHDGNLAADVDVNDNTAPRIPLLKPFKGTCVASDIVLQNNLNVPEQLMFKPNTDGSTKDDSDDGDLTDSLIGSDGTQTSEDLSPVSVLVSSFEGSPNHVYLDINCPLKELPVHLQLLEHDPNTSQTDDLKMEDSEAESIFRKADFSLPGISAATCFDDDVVPYFSCNGSPQFQYANFQMDDIGCPKGKAEDLCYIGNILSASGFTGSHESYFAKWHSPHHAVDPLLFQVIEDRFFSTVQNHSSDGRPKDPQGPHPESSCISNKIDSLHRHLLFDVVDSILLHKLKSHINYQPWFRPTKLMHVLLPSSKQLLQGIWAQVCTFYPQHEEKAFLTRPGRELANEDEWIEVQEEVQKIVLEVEQVVFCALMEEIMIDYALPKKYIAGQGLL